MEQTEQTPLYGDPTPASSAWRPAVEYDLFEGDGMGFAQAVARFRAWAKDQPKAPLNVTTGWHVLHGPQIEEILKRNSHNRDAVYSTALMYATSLVNSRWKKTGQPLILTDQDELEDGQHRLLAAYFSGKPIETFIVAGVPHEKDLFAYIDNIRPRTGEDALKIAGINGLSKHVAAVIKDIAIRYDEGMLCYAGRQPVSPITNVDVLDYSRGHPGLASAAHTVKDLYPAAVSRIGESKVATFAAWKILDMYGNGALEDFMSAMTREDLPTTHPVAVLRRRLDEHEAAQLAPRRSPKKKQLLTQVKILALTIKAFNLMQAGVAVRRLDPRADDPFPRFDEPGILEQLPEAAQ